MIFILLDMFYDPEYGLSWWLLHVSLRRKMYSAIAGKILYRRQLNQIDNVIQVIIILFSFLNFFIYQVLTGVLLYPTIMADFSISPLN